MLSAKEALKLHLKKAQIQGWSLGDWAQNVNTGDIARVEVIEIWGSGPVDLTLRKYYDDYDTTSGIEEDFPNEEPSDWNRVTAPRRTVAPRSSRSFPDTEPPEFETGALVQVIGDHHLVGAMGKIGYAYKRIANQDDNYWGDVTDGLTGWRYVVDFIDYGRHQENHDDGSSIPAKNLLEITEADLNSLMNASDTPAIQSEEDLVIE